MLGQVTIRDRVATVLRPLFRATLQNETKMLAHGIKRTRGMLGIVREAVRNVFRGVRTSLGSR